MPLRFTRRGGKATVNRKLVDDPSVACLSPATKREIRQCITTTLI